MALKCYRYANAILKCYIFQNVDLIEIYMKLKTEKESVKH